MAAPSYSALRSAHLAFVYSGLSLVVLGFGLATWIGEELPHWAVVGPGLLAMLAGSVFGMWLLHRSWSCLERHAERFRRRPRLIDPGAAVAMTVIPGVNILGVFFSLGLLPGRLNDLASAAGVKERADPSLGYLVGVLALSGLIPLIGWLIALVAGVVLVPITLFTCSKVAEAIDRRLATDAASARVN